MIDDKPRVVVAGAGVAGLETLFGLTEIAGDRLEILLIDPGDEFVYVPMAVVEPFDGVPTPRFDLDRLLGGTGVERYVDKIARVEPVNDVLITEGGRRLTYDALVLALGACKSPAIDHALTYTGTAESAVFATLLSELESGVVTDVAFVLPSGHVWALPLYELALLTATWLHERGLKANLTLVTPEQLPLRSFGLKACRCVAELLSDHDVQLMHSTHVAGYDGEGLSLVPGAHLHVQRVVTVPQLQGPAVKGVPHDAHGFLRTDGHGLVEGTTNVYAAGDGTNFPVKQGVIAAQQADAIVAAIGSRFGAVIDPRPFRPVMRGLLISPDGPLYMEAEIAGGRGDAFKVSREPLWKTADKVPGTYLSGRLAELESAVTLDG